MNSANQRRWKIDVAACETLGPNALSKLEIQQGLWVRAYTLARIAGEKLRAFLSSLPAYLEKLGRRTDAARGKDLYDIVRIGMVKPITDTAFGVRQQASSNSLANRVL